MSSAPAMSMNGTFCFWAVRIFFCIRSSQASTSTRMPRCGKQSGDVVEVVDVLLADRDADDLHRRQPGRERAGVVLGQHGEEPLDRAEQRAVDHHRTVPLAVVALVLELEALRQVEVELDRRHLPGAPDRVAGLHRDLRAVERGAARIGHEVSPDSAATSARVSVAISQASSVADVLVRVLGRQLEVEVVEAVVAEQVEDEGQQRAQLVAHLPSIVVKMCASSWVMPRTRVRPWMTPDFS